MSKVMEVIGELRDGASAILTHIKAGKSIKKDRANKTKSELARSREEKFNAEKATQIQKNALETRFGKFVQDGILVTAFDTDKKKNIEVNAVNEELTTLLNNGNTPISEILASDAYKEASEATRRVIDSAINDEPSGVVERYYDNGEAILLE